MEEKANLPQGYLDKLLVDRKVQNPFEQVPAEEAIYHYPYEDTKAIGYIRYVIRGKQMIILDCLEIERKS